MNSVNNTVNPVIQESDLGRHEMLPSAGVGMHVAPEWESLRGAFVEVRRDGGHYRSGIVDDAMPDGSAVWLAGDVERTRKYLGKADGFVIWVESTPGASYD
ncbi:hypothetical protein ACIPY3_14675 [Paenarthrobacter sp. NPDC089714]|uniref:hypothetical protein n=1 Tax=Paenarthrobacter sp. NPDC089714 TaxID=3364377 RepID=UPI003804E7FF